MAGIATMRSRKLLDADRREAARDWPRSSLHAQFGGLDDGVTAPAPVREHYPDFEALIAAGEDAERVARLRKAETIGRPVGDEDFLAEMEARSGRRLAPASRGPKPKNGDSN